MLMAENYMGFPTQDRGTKDSPSQRTRDLLGTNELANRFANSFDFLVLNYISTAMISIPPIRRSNRCCYWRCL